MSITHIARFEKLFHLDGPVYSYVAAAVSQGGVELGWVLHGTIAREAGRYLTWSELQEFSLRGNLVRAEIVVETL